MNSGGSARNLTHDDDGNLTFDGAQWHHAYDGENRLISSSNLISGVLYEYAYDYQSRRISKTTLTPNPYSSLTTKYIWDGFNIAAEIIIDHVTPATNISYYTWGLDLSGTLQGAGGVGGLLSDTKVTNSETSTFYSVGDANGNITEYVDVSGATAAHGEHTAFGETKLSGAMKDDFTHWFSSKPFDKETGFVVYQRRYYDIMLCRWISRDPFGIKGGLNEFGFVGNDGVNHCDKLGLKKLTLTYDMQSRNKVDFNEMLMMPINTVWATSMNKALKSIKKIVGKYDPKGNDCNCILKLTITGHSGVAGLINLGDGLIDPASIKNLAEVQQKYKNNPVYKEFLKKQNREKDFLISLSKLMCKEGAKIRFAQCQTEHPETRKFLERIFGEDVDVILYELDVKWQWGFPKEVEVEYCN